MLEMIILIENKNMAILIVRLLVICINYSRKLDLISGSENINDLRYPLANKLKMPKPKKIKAMAFELINIIDEYKNMRITHQTIYAEMKSYNL